MKLKEFLQKCAMSVDVKIIVDTNEREPVTYCSGNKLKVWADLTRGIDDVILSYKVTSFWIENNVLICSVIDQKTEEAIYGEEVF